MKERYCLYRVLFWVFLLAGHTSLGQSYGLSFASNEVVQDKRTGIDLSPGTTFNFSNNFDLEFEISVAPNKIEYFGYIVRVIENDERNIDLIYDNTPNHFKVVIGEKSPEIFFSVSGDSIFRKWHAIKLHFDLKNKQLSLQSGNKTYSQRLDIADKGDYKILFGENNFGRFQTTDVPPMKIRNIRIRESEALKYQWALDEDEGEIAFESVSKANAAVTNPVWIRKLHHDWQAVRNLALDGPVSSAFDSDRNILYIIGFDSLFSFNLSSGAVSIKKYESGRLNLLRGNQSYYNPATQKINNIYLDQWIISTYDPASHSWDKNFTSPSEITDNWHFNKYFSAADSSMYIFSGYGHFFYKNKIRRYNFPANTWDSIQPAGDFFTPRYLAALGATEGGAYVIGGYGSQSGQQILNPKNLYDLMFFDERKKSFKKIYDLEIKGEDFVFANSLIIDAKTRSYYALVFPKHKYNSALQLIKGSLDKPSIEFLANKIPYRFHDIHSFADVYYSAATESFVAITLFLNDNGQTEIGVYSLASPPLPAETSDPKIAKQGSGYTAVYIGIAALLVLSGGLLLRRRRKVQTPVIPVENPPVVAELTKLAEAQPQVAPVPEIKEEIQAQPQEVSARNMEIPAPANIESTQPKNAILLFGDLQLFDAEGADITKFLTPLIKELFLVILLYTIRKERGISSEKLKELLWFDKSAESARNNRSVNIAKLKSILERLNDCTVSKETGYWKVAFDYTKVRVDYFDYLNIINDRGKLDKQKVQHLALITQRGSFLSNVDYDWLDTFKSEITNMVIDTYLHYAASVNIADDPEFMVQIANYIFEFDSVNEEAMIIKCKALVHLGKHSLAKHAFENFNKEYKALYGEEFAKGFQHILS